MHDRWSEFDGTQHPANRSNTIMPASATSRGFSILQHVSAAKKFLQDMTIDARYVWNGEAHCVRLKFGLAA